MMSLLLIQGVVGDSASGVPLTEPAPAAVQASPFSWRHEVMLGGSDAPLIGFRPPLPPPPLFWEASTKIRWGVMARYLYLAYHTEEHFSLHFGGSVSAWIWHEAPVFAVSALAVLRFWAFSTRWAGAYLSYSVAGPTALTTQFVGLTNLGSQFIFQDMIGLGLRVGHDYVGLLEVQAVHYSNGYVFPVNSGFDIPFMISLSLGF